MFYSISDTWREGPLKAAVTLSLHRSNRQETGMLWADLKPPASPFSTAQELRNAASQIEMLLKTTFYKLIFKSSIPESKIGNILYLLLSKDFALHFYFCLCMETLMCISLPSSVLFNDLETCQKYLHQSNWLPLITHQHTIET